MSVLTGGFWEDDDAEEILEEVPAQSDQGTPAVDDAKIMRAKTILNRFLVARGQAPVF
jgi:hypothetical protein